MIIAIDGPAGAGKSTVSRAVAEALSMRLIDTGAIYRCVGRAGIAQGVALDDGPALAELARAMRFDFAMRDGVNHVHVDGEDVTGEIRTPEISDAASRVSSLPEVRAALLQLQRDLGNAHDAVMEGRDIGTVVFPDAELKVYLTARIEERAHRRQKDYHAKGLDKTSAELVQEIAARDRRDSERAVAPLKPAHDARQLDSTEMGFDEVVSTIVTWARQLRAA